MAQPLRPEKGWFRLRKAPEPQTVPGKQLCFQAQPGPPRSSGGNLLEQGLPEWAPTCSPGCPATHLLQGSGAGQAETSCFLCRLFIPAPSAAARPTRPANPRPRVAEAGGEESGNRFVAAGTDESTRALGLAGPGQWTDGRADRPTVLQRPADRRSARGRVGGAGGGAAVGAAAAEEPAARSEAAPCREPAAPLAGACGYGGAGLEPRDPLVGAYSRRGARIQPRLATAPPDSPVFCS